MQNFANKKKTRTSSHSNPTNTRTPTTRTPVLINHNAPKPAAKAYEAQFSLGVLRPLVSCSSSFPLKNGNSSTQRNLYCDDDEIWQWQWQCTFWACMRLELFCALLSIIAFFGFDAIGWPISDRTPSKTPSALIDDMLAESSPKHLSVDLEKEQDFDIYLQQQTSMVEPFKSLRSPANNSKTFDSSDAFYEHPNSSTNFPRNLERRPTLAPKHYAHIRMDSIGPLSPALKAAEATNKAIHTVMDKARSSLGHARSGSSSTSAKSRESVNTFDTIGVPYVDGEPVDVRKSQSFQQDQRPSSSSSAKTRPKFIEKALEAKRERDRRKNREALKASIKFVGQVDPNAVELERNKRDTFGAGWI